MLVYLVCKKNNEAILYGEFDAWHPDFELSDRSSLMMQAFIGKNCKDLIEVVFEPDMLESYKYINSMETPKARLEYAVSYYGEDSREWLTKRIIIV